MWNTAGTALENAFGGSAGIYHGTKKSGDSNKAFFIVLSSLPEEACMALATYDWGSGSSSGLIAIGINSGSLGDSFVGCTGKAASGNAATACPNGTTVSVPMPVNVAASACTTGEDNSISLKFY